MSLLVLFAVYLALTLLVGETTSSTPRGIGRFTPDALITSGRPARIVAGQTLLGLLAVAAIVPVALPPQAATAASASIALILGMLIIRCIIRRRTRFGCPSPSTANPGVPGATHGFILGTEAELLALAATSRRLAEDLSPTGIPTLRLAQTRHFPAPLPSTLGFLPLPSELHVQLVDHLAHRDVLLHSQARATESAVSELHLCRDQLLVTAAQLDEANAQIQKLTHALRSQRRQSL